MTINLLEYDAGYDAYDMGEPFDTDMSVDWQHGYLDAAADDGDFDA